MRVRLLNFTPEPEKTVSLAARVCYSSHKIPDLQKEIRSLPQEKFLERIVDLGHLSILEHALFTFGVEGISRVTSHQLVRHRVASYAQQSQRYVKLNENSDMVTPSSIKDYPEIFEEYSCLVKDAYRLYQKMVRRGIPIEDARYILPAASLTSIVISMNARELLHFFELRGCRRAQEEIREMAKMMLSLVKKEAPTIFKKGGPACLKIPCPEKDMSCGRQEEVREEFSNL